MPLRLQLVPFVAQVLLSPSLPTASTLYPTAPGLESQVTPAVLLAHTRDALTFWGAQGAEGAGEGRGEGRG